MEHEKEDNLARKERYHCHSLDAVKFEGMDYGTEETPEDTKNPKKYTVQLVYFFLISGK